MARGVPYNVLDKSLVPTINCEDINMKPFQISYASIRERRNKKRLWIEGFNLGKSGFTKGVKYRLDYDFDTGEIEGVIDPINGTHTVSGRLDKLTGKVTPIIDLCNSDIVNVTKNAKRVRIIFYHGTFKATVSSLTLKQYAREKSLIENIQKGVITEGTLCAGIGMTTAAMRQGFEEKGIQSSVEWIVDRERKYLKVAANNNRALNDNTTIVEASLEELDPELLCHVNSMQFSLGCTGHSLSGKSKNQIKLAEEHQDDATGVFGLMRTIESVNPAVLTSENVILARNSATYLLIKSMLDTLGYHVHEIELDQNQSGAFEKRPRYWFVAISKNLPQIDLLNIPKFSRQYATLSDLEDTTQDHEWSMHQYLKDKAIKDADKGNGFVRNLVDRNSTSVNTLNRSYFRRQSTPPMWVRDEDELERLLSTLEHCRVKGAPTWLIDNVCATTAHEGLGQGIDYNQCRGISQLIAMEVFTPLDGVEFIDKPRSFPLTLQTTSGIMLDLLH
jgi:DNA (cytosine-5)-methyltransferase 1